MAMSIISAMSGAELGFNGAAILLVGGGAPPGLDRECLAVGTADPAGAVSAAAVGRARRCGAFALSLKSPPDPEQLDSCLAAVAKIVEYRLGKGRPSFKGFWSDLSSVASARGASAPLHVP